MLTEGCLLSSMNAHMFSELQNNLGCTSYISGQVDKALFHYEEALRAQEIALSQSIYDEGNSATCITSLNNSITKGNLGFLALVKRDVPRSVQFLESSLRVSVASNILLVSAKTTLSYFIFPFPHSC
jgi:hypothetical protein